MSGYRRVNYYELCRLCTSSEGDKMNIFREEGRRRQLQSKIQSYLPVQVLEEDSLPKIVCHDCVRKLENYIEFRENVVNAESMLESYFTSLRFSEDFLKEGKVYVKSTEKERVPSPQDDPLKIDKVEEEDSEPLLVTEPQGQAQQVVVGNLNTSNIQIISGVQARVQQYKCAMQMQPGGVTAAVVEATAETHYSYQQQSSQLSPDNHSPQARLVEAQTPQIQVQNQIQSQPQLNLQQRSQSQQLASISQIQQLREYEKRQLQLEKEQSQSQQPQVVHTNTVLLKAPDVSPDPQVSSKDSDTHLESPEGSVQNYTAVQGTPEVFLSLNFKDSPMSQQATREDVKDFKDYIKTDDPISRNSIGQISEFLRIRTCPDTNSLLTVNPQVICENDRDLVCRDCGKNFESLDDMDSHECCPSSPLMTEIVDIKEEPLPGNGTPTSFSCDVCGKPFKRKEHLFQHRKLHTGERPYVCTTCGKAFSRKEHLVRHSVSHTGHKMHECEMCGKSFSRKDNLHKHRKTHGVSGPYICETCGKSFVVKHYYLMHLTTHAPTLADGENCPDPLPYKCDLCHKAFSVKQYLTTHKLRHRSKNSMNNAANQSQNSQSVQQTAVSTTNGVGNSSGTSSSLSNASGQSDGQVVEMQSVIDRSEGQSFGSNQYQGNVQGFQ